MATLGTDLKENRVWEKSSAKVWNARAVPLKRNLSIKFNTKHRQAEVRTVSKVRHTFALERPSC